MKKNNLPSKKERYYDGDDIDILMEEDLDAKMEEISEPSKKECEHRWKICKENHDLKECLDCGLVNVNDIKPSKKEPESKDWDIRIESHEFGNKPESKEDEGIKPWGCDCPGKCKVHPESKEDWEDEPIMKENWHAIEGSNGMCACGDEKGVCNHRLKDFICYEKDKSYFEGFNDCKELIKGVLNK